MFSFDWWTIFYICLKFAVRPPSLDSSLQQGWASRGRRPGEAQPCSEKDAISVSFIIESSRISILYINVCILAMLQICLYFYLKQPLGMTSIFVFNSVLK